MLKCQVCDRPIEIERIQSYLDATNGKELPDTCTEHAHNVEQFGLQVYGHKTAGETLVIKNPTPEQKRQMFRAYFRAR